MDFSHILTLKQHEALVTDIVEIEEPQYIATSAMDGNIKFYSVYLKKNIMLDTKDIKTVSAVNSKHKKGILGIDYTR